MSNQTLVAAAFQPRLGWNAGKLEDLPFTTLFNLHLSFYEKDENRRYKTLIEEQKTCQSLLPTSRIALH